MNPHFQRTHALGCLYPRLLAAVTANSHTEGGEIQDAGGFYTAECDGYLRSKTDVRRGITQCQRMAQHLVCHAASRGAAK